MLRSQSDFQSTNRCGLSQSGLQLGLTLGGVPSLNSDHNSTVNCKNGA